MREPVIWLLFGDKTGDNNQLQALADKLGLPYVVKHLSYNLLRAIPPRFLGTSRVSLTGDAKAQLVPPWPDLVIAIGRRSVATARWLKARHAAKTVLVGHPRVDPRNFDLVITTRQYPVPRHDNVILLPMSMSKAATTAEPNEAERELLGRLPSPHLLLSIGGPTKSWRLDEEVVADAAGRLIQKAADKGGTLIAIGSRRTPPAIATRLRDILSAERGYWIDDPAIRYATLLQDADELFVTADSISMMSEAIQTGKPVGLVPVTMSPSGERRLGTKIGDKPHRTRDLRRIWDYLQTEGLVGTIDQPRAGQWRATSIDEAAAAVRKLIGKIDA